MEGTGVPSLACESLSRATSAGVIAKPVSFRSFSFRAGLGSRLPSMTRFAKPFKSLRRRRAKSFDEPQLEESKTWPLSDESTSLPSDLCDPSFPPPRPEGDQKQASEEGEEEEETMTAEQELRSKMSASELLDYILGLLPVLRHVAAYEGLLDLRQLVEEGLARGDDEAARVKERMEKDASVVEQLAQIERLGKACKDLLDSDVSQPGSGWTLCARHRHTKTYCQDVGDGKSTRVRIEGYVPVSPMQQLAVIRESQLYTRWLPLCRDSRLLERTGLADQILYIRIGTSFFGVDLLLNGWGSDCLVEDASVLVLAESVEAPLARAPHAPRRMDGFTFRRVSLYDVKFKFQALSPDSSFVVVTFIIDPHVSHINGIINFFIKKCAASLFHFIYHQALHVVKDGRDHHLTQAMNDDPAFYRDYLCSRFWWLCRAMGYTTAPPAFTLLGTSSEEAEARDPYHGRAHVVERRTNLHHCHPHTRHASYDSHDLTSPTAAAAPKAEHAGLGPHHPTDPQHLHSTPPPPPARPETVPHRSPPPQLDVSGSPLLVHHGQATWQHHTPPSSDIPFELLLLVLGLVMVLSAATAVYL